MEFGYRPVANRSATRFEQVQAISTYRDSSNLVADRFEANFHYAILVAGLVADLQSWNLAYHALSSLLAAR